MIRLTRSLYGRLSLVYLGLLLAFCTASVFFTLETILSFVQETDQKLNRTLAEDLAARMAPYTADRLDTAGAAAALADVMQANPRVEAYVLDDAGRVLVTTAPPEKVVRPGVALDPVARFLAGADLPVTGTDPLSPAGDKTFSAAPLPLAGGRTGYLYVILRSMRFDSAAEMVRNSYILRTAGINLGITFFFTGLIGLLLFGFLTRRFRAITHTVNAFAQGRLEERIAPGPDDELGRLARTINRMAASLHTHMEELRHRDARRREFIANISHDLQSPLTSIKGYVETAIMKHAVLPEAERLQYLHVVREEAERLQRLVAALLELARLDVAQPKPEREPFAIAELVQDVVVKHRPLAAQLGLDLRATLSGDLPLVCADIAMIERVLANLIDNALRYTPAGGTVDVGCCRRDGHVHVRVADTGYGIPAGEIARVTDRFYKVKGNYPRTSGGTGQGLAIAKRVLELHQADLHIESAVGGGTSVAFELPLAGAGGC